MRFIRFKREILKLEVEQFAHGGIEPHLRKGARRARQLLTRLIEMVQVEMRVAKREHELTWLEPGHLRHHEREERIRSDVERHAEEKIGAALVHLARKLAVGDVELEQRVARGQRHAVDVGGVPRRNEVATGVGPRFKIFNQLRNLIDFSPVRRAPVAPLVAVDRAELAALVRPFVPYADAALLEPLDVRVAAQEPQQLVDDRLEMQLLGGEQREALAEREAQLAAEDRKRAGTGAVGFARASLEDFREQGEIRLLAHTTIAPNSSRALWKRSSGFFASSR